MPSVDEHFSLASEYTRAVRKLADASNCRPLSVIAYYAAMHLFEGMYALPIPGMNSGNKSLHCHGHRERIAHAIKNMKVFGDAPTKALKSLYDFSYMARYIRLDVSVSTKGEVADPPKTILIDLESQLENSEQNLIQVLTRLNKIIIKTKEKFPNHPVMKSFPEISDLIPQTQNVSEQGGSPEASPMAENPSVPTG